MQRVGLHQKTIQLDTIEELAQCRDLAAGVETLLLRIERL